MTLCDPMDCRMPGFPVFHDLLKFAPIHIHWVSDAIQASHTLSPPSHLALKSFPASGSFPMSQLFTSGGQSIGDLASTSALIEYSGLIWSAYSPTDSQESSPAPQFGGISSSVLSQGAILIFIRDYRKNYSTDYKGLCQQNDVFSWIRYYK